MDAEENRDQYLLRVWSHVQKTAANASSKQVVDLGGRTGGLW